MGLSLQTFPTASEAQSALAAQGTRYMGGGTLVVRAANEGDLSFSTIVRTTDPALSVIGVPGGKVTINWLAYTRIPKGSPPLVSWLRTSRTLPPDHEKAAMPS